MSQNINFSETLIWNEILQNDVNFMKNLKFSKILGLVQERLWDYWGVFRNVLEAWEGSGTPQKWPGWLHQKLQKFDQKCRPEASNSQIFHAAACLVRCGASKHYFGLQWLVEQTSARKSNSQHAPNLKNHMDITNDTFEKKVVFRGEIQKLIEILT